MYFSGDQVCSDTGYYDSLFGASLGPSERARDEKRWPGEEGAVVLTLQVGFICPFVKEGRDGGGGRGAEGETEWAGGGECFN